MRLLSFRAKRNGPTRVGVLVEGSNVLPLPFGGMIELIEAGRKAIKIPRKGKPLKLSSVQVLAPIPRPRKNVFCVGWNYLEHFEEGKKMRVGPQQEMPAHPTFFTKTVTAVNGPYDRIPLHAGVTEKLDWEVELGVIIGRRGTNIAEADA